MPRAPKTLAEEMLGWLWCHALGLMVDETDKAQLGPSGSGATFETLDVSYTKRLMCYTCVPTLMCYSYVLYQFDVHIWS